MERRITFKNGNVLVMEGIHYIKLYYKENKSSMQRFLDQKGNLMDFNTLPLDYFGLYGGFNRQNLDSTDNKKIPKRILANTSDVRKLEGQEVGQNIQNYDDMYDLSMALKYKPRPENSKIHFVVAPYDFTCMDIIVRAGEYFPKKIDDFEPIGENPVKWVDYEHRVIYYVLVKGMHNMN